LKDVLDKIKAALAEKDGGDAKALAILTEHEEAIRTPLERTRDSALAEAKSAKSKMKAFAEIDLDEYKAQAAKIDELETALKDKPDVAGEVKRATDKQAKELEKAAKALATEKAAVHRLIVDAGLTAELMAAGVTTGALPYVRAMFVPQAKVSEDGEERVATIGDKPLKEAVGTWAKTEEAKLFIKASPNTGGGASNNGHGGTGGKRSIARSAFDRLTPAEQMDFVVKEGGTVTDAVSA
jgi:hypothetical protein